MSEISYDVIVIGAGPAGSVAAEACARSGLRTALIEKQRLPRHKTCGGGMPAAIGASIRDLAPEAFVESTVRLMRHTWNFGEAVVAPVNPPGAERDMSLWMVQRSVFDNALAQRAARAGADLRDALPVRGLEAGESGVAVICDGFAARARYVIGADGANGVTARMAGLRRDRLLAIAQEVEHPHTWGSGHPDLRPEVLHLEYGAIPRGYAWVFPKSGHLNVGAGLFRVRGADNRGDSRVRQVLQSAIHGYLHALDVPFDPQRLTYHAHPLPIWNGREPLSAHAGRILLVGDAAGLVNPVFGDGILHAARSGLIAALCIAEGRADQYTEAIHAEFAPNFDAANNLARFFYQWTRLVYRHAIKRPLATHTAARLLSGDALFTDVASRALSRLRHALRSGSSTDPHREAAPGHE